MTIGQKIKSLRKDMDISQEILGEILNVSRQAITKWETDAGVPDVSNLQALSKLFGVSIDYFLTDKQTDIVKQLDIDITKYRESNEENVQIIRHFYSEEWKANFLSYMIYPKNVFTRIGLFIMNFFSSRVTNSLIVGKTLYDIDKFNDNYYLLTRDDLIYIAYITKNRLEVKNITNMIKIRNRNIINNQKHFIYDNKMFSIFKWTKAEDLDNKKIFISNVKFSLKLIIMVLLPFIILFVILTLPLIIHFLH